MKIIIKNKKLFYLLQKTKNVDNEDYRIAEIQTITFHNKIIELTIGDGLPEVYRTEPVKNLKKYIN